MADFTTVATVRNYLPTNSPVYDVLVARLITAASDLIEAQLSRTVLVQQYSERRSGNNSDLMMMRNIPIQTVNQVVIDGVSIPRETTYGAGAAPGPGFYFDDLMVGLVGYTFTRGRRNVLIDYTAGFLTVPAAIEQACIDLVVRKMKMRHREGELSNTVGPESITFDQKDMSESTRSLLQPFNTVAPIVY